MTDFNEAYEITMKNEGGYANDPDDPGQETYRGISRLFHPEWDGWKVIDSQKSDPDFPDNIPHESLEGFVRNFYEKNYWDKINASHLVDQDLANTLFDIAVNMGWKRAGMFLQKSLNHLNRNEKSWKSLIVDGLIGKISLHTLKKCIALGDIKYLIKVIKLLKGNYYLNIIDRKPSQKKFLRGWLNR